MSGFHQSNSAKPDQHVSTYCDPKRSYWILSLLVICVPLFSVLLFKVSGNNVLALTFPLVFFYIVIPAADLIFGEDTSNLPPEAISELSADPYYCRLLHVAVIMFWVSFVGVSWFVGGQDLPLWAFLIFAWGVGAIHGDVITISHELGHKQNRVDQFFAKLANALIGYGHFCIEHNRGHHVWVATPEDPASARMGESIYQFMAREIPGALRRGWEHEAERLNRQGLRVWSWRNDILQGYAITFGVAVLLIAIFGWKMIIFLAIHHVFGWLMLTQANYVQHYGLLRQKRSGGGYELCEPHHSWNSNHVVSNLMSFHLQRHSDHHAHPIRPYQVLRDFPDLPRLPSGYPGCFALAAVPPLWFRVMDPKVLAWAQNDLHKINMCPRKADSYNRLAVNSAAR